MKKCPYCAEEIQDEAIFCRFCKHDLKNETTVKTIKCPYCSEDTPKNSQVCKHCRRLLPTWKVSSSRQKNGNGVDSDTNPIRNIYNDHSKQMQASQKDLKGTSSVYGISKSAKILGIIGGALSGVSSFVMLNILITKLGYAVSQYGDIEYVHPVLLENLRVDFQAMAIVFLFSMIALFASMAGNRMPKTSGLLQLTSGIATAIYAILFIFGSDSINLYFSIAVIIGSVLMLLGGIGALKQETISVNYKDYSCTYRWGAGKTVAYWICAGIAGFVCLFFLISIGSFSNGGGTTSSYAASISDTYYDDTAYNKSEAKDNIGTDVITTTAPKTTTTTTTPKATTTTTTTTAYTVPARTNEYLLDRVLENHKNDSSGKELYCEGVEEMTDNGTPCDLWIRGAFFATLFPDENDANSGEGYITTMGLGSGYCEWSYMRGSGYYYIRWYPAYYPEGNFHDLIGCHMTTDIPEFGEGY